MNERILIVDDEKGIVDMLKSYFERRFFLVYTACSGEEALRRMSHSPDLILLDINMPDLDGLTVCEKIRSHISCPILFLTARIDSADKIKGFQAGGDDYIVKPFDIEELGARVEAHLRREHRKQEQSLLRFFSDMVIDYSRREVTIGGRVIGLSRKEFDIVELLSINAGQVFDRERIYELVWGLEGDGSSNTAIGDTLSLKLQVGVMDGSLPEYAYSADFILTGILESSYYGYATGTVEGIVGMGTAQMLLPEEYLLYSTDFKTHSKQDFQDIVRELAASLQVEERYIQYNWLLLDVMGISYDEGEKADTGSGFPFMVFACILVGVLVLAAAGLVIYNVLKIAITKKIREYGTLRAIGGERGQIYRLVSLQLLILCGIGIPVGLLLGIFSAKAVLTAATGILNPKVLMADNTEQLNAAIDAAAAVNLPMLLASVAVTLLFAIFAAFPAARYASRVSPTVAMSGQTVRIRRRVKKNRKIRHFEAYYARLNLKRGRGRTAITVLSLVMSITVFVALQSFTGLLDASKSVQDMYLGDYAVTNETAGIDAEAVAALQAQDAVEGLSTVKLSIFQSEEEVPFDTDLAVLSHETLQIVGLDEERLLGIAKLNEQDRQDLLEGRACFIKNPIVYSYGGTEIQHTSLAVGDIVTINGRALRIAGLVDGAVTINNDGFLNGVQIIANDQVYFDATGKDSYAEVYPLLKEDENAETFEAWLEEWCQSLPGTHWLSYRQAGEEMAESFEQIRMLCWALILFVGVIGILNIINTVYSNIHTRIGEIGMQRAIGMSAASLQATFLREGAYYGIFASVIGAVLGYVCCVFVGAAQTDSIKLVAIPFTAIGEAAVISIMACLLATAVPLRSIAKLDIVSTIENVE